MASQESGQGGGSREEYHGDEEVRELLFRLLRLVAREVAVRLRCAFERSVVADPGGEGASTSGQDEERTEDK